MLKQVTGWAVVTVCLTADIQCETRETNRRWKPRHQLAGPRQLGFQTLTILV